MAYAPQRSHSPKVADYPEYDPSRKRPRNSIDSTADFFDTYNPRGATQSQGVYSAMGQSLPAQSASLVQAQNINWNQNQTGISSPPSGDFSFRYQTPSTISTSSPYISPPSRHTSFVPVLNSSSFDIQNTSLLGNTIPSNSMSNLTNAQMRYPNQTYATPQYTSNTSMTMPQRLSQSSMSTISNQTVYPSIDPLTWDPDSKRPYGVNPPMQ